MAKTRRTPLKHGDKVCVGMKNTSNKWRGRSGKVVGVRGDDRTWTVIFSKRSRDWSVFYRHELTRAKK